MQKKKCHEGFSNRSPGYRGFQHHLTICLEVKLNPAQFRRKFPTVLGAAQTAEMHAASLQLQV